MPRILLLSFFVLGNCFLLSASDANQSVTVSFYSEQLTINYHPEMVIPEKVHSGEQGMVAYFHRMEQSPYHVLLEDLRSQGERLRLNDWLYYQLLEKSVAQIFQTRSDLEIILSCWFLLSKSGFDTRLTFLDDQAFVYVYTEEEIFEVPIIEDKGRSFVNLTSILKNISSQKALYLLNFTPNPEGRSFTFSLSSLPDLSPQSLEKSLRFTYKGEQYQLRIETDLTISQLMKTYPFIAENQYLEVPLSQMLNRSLIPQLRRVTETLPEAEAVAFLASFTRSSFRYKEDKEYFGHSKPMIADEVFYYPYSDCEDRSALFYCLVKELLDLPMIIIAYRDHLTIGVALNGLQGSPIHFAGKDYFICDPTGPVDSSIIGLPPAGYEEAAFEIIGSYR